MLNVDEILRIPSTKLLVNLRGNKPLLLDKVIYKEHPLAKRLKDNPISDYNPKWTKNNIEKLQKYKNEKVEEIKPKKEKIGWNNF